MKCFQNANGRLTNQFVKFVFFLSVAKVWFFLLFHFRIMQWSNLCQNIIFRSSGYLLLFYWLMTREVVLDSKTVLNFTMVFQVCGIFCLFKLFQCEYNLNGMQFCWVLLHNRLINNFNFNLHNKEVEFYIYSYNKHIYYYTNNKYKNKFLAVLLSDIHYHFSLLNIYL